LQPIFPYEGKPYNIVVARHSTDIVDKGRPRLKKAIADAYSPFFRRTLDPDTEVTITTGANEGRKYRSRAAR